MYEMQSNVTWQNKWFAARSVELNPRSRLITITACLRLSISGLNFPRKLSDSLCTGFNLISHGFPAMNEYTSKTPSRHGYQEGISRFLRGGMQSRELHEKPCLSCEDDESDRGTTKLISYILSNKISHRKRIPHPNHAALG